MRDALKAARDALVRGADALDFLGSFYRHPGREAVAPETAAALRDAIAAADAALAVVADERVEFEAWAQNCPMGNFSVQRDTRADRDDGYLSSHTQIMWDAWTARSRLSAPADVVEDAARYRWLIDTFGDHRHGLPSIEAAFDDDIDDWRSATFFSLRTKDQFDAAIDLARKEQKA